MFTQGAKNATNPRIATPSKNAATPSHFENRELLEVRQNRDAEIVLGQSVLRGRNLGQISERKAASRALFGFAFGKKLVAEGARNELAHGRCRIP